VTDTTNHVTEEQGTSSAARIGWAVLILATLYVCYFSHLGAIGFVGPDEPRYAWIARDMMETGDWITPRLYGKPWFEKPVLYYWGAALCFRLFGVSEAAARLPSAISALLATLALAWLALRLYGAETARWLLLLLPTTVGMIGFSHAAAPDMPFSGMLTIAMVAAAVVLGLVPQTTAPSSFVSLTSSTSSAAVLFGFSLGLAVLAKGPAAIILCGGSVFFWALFTKRWRDTLRLLHPTPIIAFCVTALPWYILCASRNPDFFRVFIIEHNFRRYLTPEFQHVQPFWFYVPIILLALFPWTAVLVWTLFQSSSSFKRGRRLTGATCFFLSWSGFCVAFFTISQSKLPGYILPAIPVMGLLMARSISSLALEHRKSFGITLLALALAVVSLSLVLGWTNGSLVEKLGAFQAPVAVVVLFLAFSTIILGAAFLCSAKRSARSLSLVLSVMPIIISFGYVDAIFSHTPTFVISSRYLAHEIQGDEIPVDKLRVSRLTRSTRYGLNFYLRTDLTDWDRNSSGEVYLLDDRRLSCREQPEEMICSDLWVERERFDTFTMLHLTPKR
jgi:4-amino-4-deoxy-L-arabinose transferase-like glycosyltransferase